MFFRFSPENVLSLQPVKTQRMTQTMKQTMTQTMKQWKLLAAVMMLGGAMGLTSCSDDGTRTYLVT